MTLAGRTLNTYRDMVRRFGAAFAALVMLCILPAAAFAQTQSIVSDEGTIVADVGAEGRIINSVRVQGTERIEDTTVLAYMVIGRGDPYSAQAADASLKVLYETGYFADIIIQMTDDALTVRVVENPIINQVIFSGNRAIKDDDLESEIESSVRQVYTRARVQSDVQRILEVYRRSGRFSTNVVPQIVELPQNRVDLIFEVTDGPVTGVRRINFLGNDIFSDRRLRTVVATQESKWYWPFSSNDNYDPDRLTFDREQLRRFYLSKGYADFRVVSSVAELTSDRNDFFITFTMEEGEQYRVGDIIVETQLDRLDEDVLRRNVPIYQGEVYNADFIESAVDNLTFLAGIHGYAFVDVRPRIHRNREDLTVDVTFEVDEGPRVYIERINIVGNTRTLDRVIRREFRLVEGDAFNRVLVERSRSRVGGLGFFESVEITEEPGSLPDRTVLNVEVEEKATGEISFGFGFSSADAYVLDLSISERNFLGRGQFLRFAMQFSARTRQVDIRFTEPYFMGRNLAAGFDLFQVRNDYVESDFATETSGGGVRLGFPISDNNRVNLRYTVRQESIQPDDGLCAPGRYVVDDDNDGKDDDGVIPVPSICRLEGSTWLSLLGYTFTSDHRNNPLEPTRGYALTIDQDIAGVGGDIHYLRSAVDARWYYAPFERGFLEEVVLTLSGSGGYIFDWGSDDGTRDNDRFFKGGSSFRGFEPSGVGPRSLITGNALGGRMFAIGTVEVGLPLPIPDELGIQSAAFFDFGTVGLLTDEDIGGSRFRPFAQDDLSFRSSVGVSIFWDSPFGPVRVDLAEALAREDYDITESFRFSGGTRF